MSTTIHPSAVVHPGAKIGDGCEIGPYCTVGEHVVLGERCKLHSHVVVDGHTHLGRENEAFPFSTLGLKSQDLKWKGGVTRTEIGNRNVFREGVTVHSATNDGEATVIGDDNLFLTHAHVAHDCRIGNRAILSGFAGLAGHVVVGDYAILSGYVAVHQFCRIGKLAMVGGCSKVRQDVPPFMLADGSPAETRTINKVGLERAGMPDTTITALRQASKILFRDGLTITNALARIESDLPVLPELQHLVEFIRASERGISK
jgi:UDP-N-acetylglucosamine acyltransferase